MRYFELTKDMISDMEKQGFIKVAIYAREDMIKPCENEKLYVYLEEYADIKNATILGKGEKLCGVIVND